MLTDCLLTVAGIDYGLPPCLANLLVGLPTVLYLRQELRLDVLFAINDVRGDVSVRFREAIRPEEQRFMTEEDLQEFLASGTDEFMLRENWEWLSP